MNDTSTLPQLDWPLMANNVTREDLDALIAYLQQPEPRLTQGPQVQAFEAEWSQWLGVKRSVFVNSGSSANVLTMKALRILKGPGEVIVPTLTWVSDVAAVLHAGLTPVFVDIDPYHLGMATENVLERISDDTRAVFFTHVLGYNGLTEPLLAGLKDIKMPLIEDVCESHGATHLGKKLGSHGWASNFSFYYAHHMSTIEGGMVCTDDDELFEVVRSLRSHGMVREAIDPAWKAKWPAENPDLNPDFIFAYDGYNMRSTELNAVIGRAQLPKLDAQNLVRASHLDRFLDGLDGSKYRTDFVREGNANYALTLVLKEADPSLWAKVESALRAMGVEFRRGLSGGGNQVRQPYLKGIVPEGDWQYYPATEHVHFYGAYLGNYPSLDPTKIDRLVAVLNAL